MKSESVEGATEAWRRYVNTGRVAPDLLRERTYLSWIRCHEQGTNPRATSSTRLPVGEAEARIREEALLIEASRPYLRALSLAAGADPHAALLSDEEGVVLDIVADDQTMEAQRAGYFPGPGVLMSERAAGSNGIGTAIAENDYVEVIGPEHFVERLRSFTCQGLPLRGPTGHRVGALAMSVRSLAVGDRVRELLFCAANGIEAELTRQRLEALAEEIVGALGESNASLVDELCRDLTYVHAGAFRHLEAAAQMAREDRPQNVRPLLLAMDALVQRFRRQSELWKDLAGEEVRPPQPIDLDQRLIEVIELFEAEAHMRGVHVTLEERSGAVVVAGPRTLLRLLFRVFMEAFGAASRNTAIALRVANTPGATEVKVAFSTGHELVLPRAFNSMT